MGRGEHEEIEKQDTGFGIPPAVQTVSLADEDRTLCAAEYPP